MEFHNSTTEKNETAKGTQNNNVDTKSVEKTIFIDRIIKLALEDKIFNDLDVLAELKTILLAVSSDIEDFSIIFLILTKNFLNL